VHAGIPPQWSIDDALGYGNEVQQVLNSPQRIDFFKQMYGNEPAVWSEGLRGMDRLRAITNYLTRMRFCNENGMLDFESKGPTPNTNRPPQGPKTVKPWFSHPKRRTAQDRIIFGHWASMQGNTNNLNAIGLDTGCVWGGHMTLYHLETGEIRSCECS
jgi:bis(5'-nucleosyl)-tetraphosphatase (symmetrical)